MVARSEAGNSVNAITDAIAAGRVPGRVVASVAVYLSLAVGRLGLVDAAMITIQLIAFGGLLKSELIQIPDTTPPATWTVPFLSWIEGFDTRGLWDNSIGKRGPAIRHLVFEYYDRDFETGVHLYRLRA